MASLLERLDIPPSTTGPVRSRTSSSRGSTPYSRRPPRGDPDSNWTHDLYDDPASQPQSLAARISHTPSAPRAGINTLAQKALRAATGSDELAIKGASTAGNVVEVTGLVAGTTAEDVAAIFKRCGPITASRALPGPADGATIRVTFKAPSSATAAVAKFHGQPADGRTLSVRIIGGAATSLGGRLGGADGLGIVRQEGSVDVLMESTDGTGGSKMRSDALVAADPRAQVLVAPPGADPAEYTVPAPNGRGRGRGRGGRARGGRPRGQKMDVDR